MPHKITQKDGASTTASPAVCLTNAGSRDVSQVSKFEALFNVLGHSIARFPDGRTVQVTPGALKIINLSHGGLSA